MPVYKDTTDTEANMAKTLLDFDRAVKTSNELGLHLRRANKACKPFEVLLNLEKTEADPTQQFDSQRSCPIMPEAKLLTLAYTSAENYSERLMQIMVSTSKPNSVQILVGELAKKIA